VCNETIRRRQCISRNWHATLTSSDDEHQLSSLNKHRFQSLQLVHGSARYNNQWTMHTKSDRSEVGDVIQWYAAAGRHIPVNCWYTGAGRRPQLTAVDEINVVDWWSAAAATATAAADKQPLRLPTPSISLSLSASSQPRRVGIRQLAAMTPRL